MACLRVGHEPSLPHRAATGQTVRHDESMRAIVPTTDVPAGSTNPRQLTELLTEVVLPTPSPLPGQVRIRVAAVGVNAADRLQVRGHYPPPPGVTPILGLECAGTIDAVGRGVSDLEATGQTLTDLSVGAPVCALLPGGAYAEFVCVDARHVLPLPQVPHPATFTSPLAEADVLVEASPLAEAGPMVEAAALVEAAAASWMMLQDVGSLRPASTPKQASDPKQASTPKQVLIHGASGAVGSIAVQLAATWDHQVLATAGSPQRCRQVEDLGAVTCFDYHDDWAAAVKERGGADLIMDVIGAAGLGDNIRALARQGTLAVLGMIKGAKAELNIGQLIAKNATITARTVRSQSDEEKARLCRHLAEDVWPLIASGAVRPVVGKAAPMSEVGTVLAPPDKDRSGAVFGKTVLTAQW